MSDAFAPILKRLVGGEMLDADSAAAAFGQIMSGQVGEAQMAAFLTALALRGAGDDEIVGAARAMRGAMTTIAAPPGAIDLCGTGGDGHGTLNVSTATTFVVAACGVAVAKHGNRSISSRTGAADVLEALGVKTDLPPQAAEAMLAETNFCFLFAPAYHPAMKHVAGVRRALGFRTIFNVLGPLCNPAKVKRQLLGVFARDFVLPVANVLEALGTAKAWVVHGGDGLDEMTTTGATHVAVLEHGKIAQRDVRPEDVGLPRATLSALAGGDAKQNADAIRTLLSGTKGAFRDITVLNAAAALVVADKADDLKAGAALAAEAIDSGKAKSVLARVASASQKAAA
ncbi:MAG TPA: anthranilate phosphoribosyltransferase [Rhizomicrobium sp.]|jgi:anthranilate phosphoribosyltransferase